MTKMTKYVAISRTNEFSQFVLDVGDNKEAVTAEAQTKITPKNEWDIENQTLQRNLTVVSQTVAKRQYGVDAGNLFENEFGFYEEYHV